jgi:epoxide hydrolase 4
VHGFPDFWFGWRHQLNEFSKDFYVVAIDQRGFGESDKPQKLSDYNVDEMVEDLRQLVRKLGKFYLTFFKKFSLLIFIF